MADKYVSGMSGLTEKLVEVSTGVYARTLAAYSGPAPLSEKIVTGPDGLRVKLVEISPNVFVRVVSVSA